MPNRERRLGGGLVGAVAPTARCLLLACQALRTSGSQEADRSNQIGPGADGQGQRGVGGDVLNIFHHQLAEVAVIKRKKLEFSIRTHYDEFDPMARPEEHLKLRAKTQAEFEQWVDALTTWSQGLQSMSLLKF